MEPENDLVHQETTVNKPLIITIIVTLVSCVMLFFQRSVWWLCVLIVAGFYGLYLSKVKKQEDDDF